MAHQSRREFLRTSAATVGAAGLSLAADDALRAASVRRGQAESCVFLFLTGGPSHIDTFDPKPDAPAEIRGPFTSIATSVPGIRISEHLPRMAANAHRYAIVRSMHHTVSPIHETGQQFLQTGRLSRGNALHPHVGAVLAQRFGSRQPGAPPFVMIPRPIANTGVSIYHGQGAGFLGGAHEPAVRDVSRGADCGFAALCTQATGLVESGVRCVVVNMFDSVFDRVTWDCHADSRFLRSTLDDYRRTLCPDFDGAFTALIDDLHQRGLLSSTLVVAAGEFGRTPRLNAGGGRYHWPGVWSVLLAGGGVRGGRVIGASDKHGVEPARRPVHAADIAATVYHAFGIDARADLIDPHGEKVRLTEGRPIHELFE